MEVLKVQLARTIWLFDTQELNPKGVSFYPQIYDRFSKRYQFTGLPKPEEIHSGGSLYFKHGKFVSDSLIVEVDFDLHGDGLVASCRHSTEAAHEFLLDFIGWLGEQLGITYSLRVTKKRIYRSELIVQMEPNLGALSKKIEEFSRLVSELSQRQIQPSGVIFGEDNGSSPALTLERRASTPWDENRYFSAATMPTAQHVEALTKFEQIMAE
jgi:hypothetical protein